MLYGIHQGLSKITGEDALAIDDTEAKLLGVGVSGVLAFHKVKITPKQEAYAVLMEAMAQVYGPMAAVVYMKFKLAQDEKRKATPPAPSQPNNVMKWPPTHDPNKKPPPPTGFDPGNIEVPRS